MKWYKRDPNAALDGMACLSYEECGFYNKIIDAFYSRDGNLPDDDWLLGRITHGDIRQVRRLKLALMQKGKLSVDFSGRLAIPRGVATLEDSQKFSELQRERAEKRWKNNDEAMPLPAKPLQPHPQPQPQPHKKEREEVSIDMPPSAADTETGKQVEIGEVRQASKKGPRSSPKVPFPEGWVEEGAEFEAFRDSALAHDRRYASWQAAWRNWQRNAPKFTPRVINGGQSGAYRKKPTLNDYFDNRIAEFERIEQENGTVCESPRELGGPKRNG